MGYSNHFDLADNMIIHLDTVIGSITDPFITSRYVGFVAVAAVTVYELAIKEIFIDFATKKNKAFGTFAQSHFDRINGRIKTRDLKREYITRFGEKYLKRFDKKLHKAEDDCLRTSRISILSCYANIVTWRNEFAHAGQIPQTVTYNEIKTAYQTGKEVIRCLAEAMQR